MRALSLFVALFAAVQCSGAYSPYNRQGGYASSSSYASSSMASSSSSAGVGAAAAAVACCQLNAWGYTHMDEIRQLANRLRLEYNNMSQGTTTAHSDTPPGSWNEHIISLTGKTESELDALSRRLGEQLVTDMRKGLMSYATIAQPGFFEWTASEALQACTGQDVDFGQQLQMELPHQPAAMVYHYPVSPYAGGGSSSTTTITRKQTIRDWASKNMEPDVMNYKPLITMDSYRPAVHIPVDGDVETFGHTYAPSVYRPGSMVTIKRVNKTIITNADGTNTVHGSEVNRKWVDGKLVYDTERPFGEWTVPRDDAWKREERERFFWFLSPGASATAQSLEEWQRQQEDRLLAMAQRYHTSIEEIQAWHRNELERFRVLQTQYQAQSNDELVAFKRMERGRLDWLIHQNSVTRDELERWQRENHDKLVQLARRYRISIEELKRWQVDELNRLYVYFNDQNNSMVQRPDADALHIGGSSNAEQQRLDALIRQHNETIGHLQSSIMLDQQKLLNLSQSYRGNVQDMEKWLKSELARLGGVLTEQRNEMARITEWQRSERERLAQIVQQHRGSVEDVETKMARDRLYIQQLAAKYHVSIEELEKWQREELQRLQTEGQVKLETDIGEWQRREREHLKDIIKKNDLTIEEFQAEIMNDKARLQQLAATYKIQVSEVEDWIRNEVKNFQSEGLLKEVQKELAMWQQQERDRLLAIVQQNSVSVDELELKIKQDQSHLQSLAGTYQIRVEEIEAWLRKELQRLQAEGLLKVDDLKDWQQNERNEILKIVQQNKLTIEEFEQKLLADRQRLQDLSATYNVQTSEIETWIKKEGERLQSLGLLQMQEQLNNWQQIERDRLLELVRKNNLSISELEAKIKTDQVHLYSLAHQHQVRVEEIEEWIKKEIGRLQQEGLIEMEKLKDWQSEWRGKLETMVKDRDFTVEEFHKWLLEDRARLQALAMQHNVQIEEIERWVSNEEQRFVAMGLLKPNEKLTNWQEVERRYLERITQEQYHSTEQLEARLRQDRELLEKLARDYSVQVEEIEKWMKKELARLRDDGQLQIDNLTAWQQVERERLEQLSKQQKQWSAAEFEAVLGQDRERMRNMAFQYHTSVEEIEKWVQSEVGRLERQGKLDIDKLSLWQQAERQRIMSLLQQQSGITVEEFERKLQQDRQFLQGLAAQHHVSVVEVEQYVQQVVDDLRKNGQFAVEKLQTWQLVERDYIKQLIDQHKNALSTAELEQRLLADRTHLRQLSDQYRVNIAKIEKFMIDELQRLRQESEQHMQGLSAWQVAESQRLRDLLKQHNQLTYVEYEVELLKDRARLNDLATQYSVSVEQIEQWLRQQLINLKATGEVQVESLTQWQDDEQKRLIGMLLQQHNNISFEEFEKQLQHDRQRLQELSREYSVSVDQIQNWMRDELQRLKSSGLLKVEELTYWQKIERDRLQDWLKQQHNGATFEELNAFLRRDEDRLHRIAQDYHVTVEEVETWVQQEGARLQILGTVARPQKFTSEAEWRRQYDWHIPHNVQVITTGEEEEMWKEQTRAHLQAIAQVKPMNWEQFEQYLKDERMRWEQFARQYNITVEEIEVWLRQAAGQLAKQGLIEVSGTVEKWEATEKLHIQNLINEKLRMQQQWSIEELERQLRADREHLQRVAQEYHITIEQLEESYSRELQRLLSQQRIVSENLVDWQRREKDRLYRLVTAQRPGLSLQTFEEQVLRDRATLNRLADEYHVSITELEAWLRNELRRLGNLGLVKDERTSAGSEYSRWQQQERERLRTIAAELIISEEELLEYIAGDGGFQQQLARLYGCGLQQLAPFQRIEIGVMQREGLFDRTQLLHPELWQQQSRDLLYRLIKNQNFSMKNVRDWQRQDVYFNESAAKYGITVQALKDWQLHEFERLMKLAEHYQYSLNQLQDFRDKELRYRTYVMHKKTSTDAERIDWGASEAKRMALLERKTGLGGDELLAWRRKLYLLCQGLIPLDFGGYGGHETGHGSTNITGIPKQQISMDRGDQPPNVYDENLDSNEPGLAGQDPMYPPPPAQLIDASTQDRQPPATVPPYQPTGIGGVQGGYRYRKQQYKITIPVGDGDMAALADDSSDAFNGMSSHALTSDAHSQQQQEQLVEDLGKQHQVELAWNADLKANDGGQQQLQLAELNGSYAGSSSSSHGSYHSSSHSDQQQQQQEIDDFDQQQVQVEDLDGMFTNSHQAGVSQKHVVAPDSTTQVEVKTEAENPGFLGKLKNKASSWFG